jgi:hypothetical protein
MELSILVGCSGAQIVPHQVRDTQDAVGNGGKK